MRLVLKRIHYKEGAISEMERIFRLWYPSPFLTAFFLLALKISFSVRMTR